MKLLPPREVETHTNANKTAELQRITAIRSQLSREERDLNDWNDSLEDKKRQASKDFEDKIMAMGRAVRDLEESIANLQEKRDILLRPLDDTPEVITSNLAVTEDLLEYLGKRKKEVLKNKEELEKLKGEAERKLSDLLRKEDRLNGREVEIERRFEGIKAHEEVFSKEVENFTVGSNRKNIESMLFQNSLAKKEVELAERERLVAQANEKIAQDRKRIESQQQSLIAALAEIKNKT